MSALHTPISTIKVGDKVLFWPSHDSLAWAAGMRTVAGFEGDMVRLECGNIKLLAKESEIKKYEYT
jgi:hypothetical protein